MKKPPFFGDKFTKVVKIIPEKYISYLNAGKKMLDGLPRVFKISRRRYNAVLLYPKFNNSRKKAFIEKYRDDLHVKTGKHLNILYSGESTNNISGYESLKAFPGLRDKTRLPALVLWKGNRTDKARAISIDRLDSGEKLFRYIEGITTKIQNNTIDEVINRKPSEIKDELEQIKRQIEHNKIKEALNLLEKQDHFFPGHIEPELLKSELDGIEQDEIDATLTQKEINAKENRLKKRVLKITEIIEGLLA